MPTYEIVAFYKKEESEVSVHAQKFSELYNLALRYEKLPHDPDVLNTMLGENTVVCLFGRETMSFRKLLRYVYHVTKPILLVRPGDSVEAYNDLKVPVGYLQENKEKVVWANFFLRQNPASSIELVVPEEKDEHIAAMVHNNVSFIRKIFDNSGTRYTVSVLKGSFEKNLKQVFGTTDKAIVLIMRPFRIFSMYVPLNLRIFKRYSHTPTLIIPRDDELYIPCN